MGNKRADAGTNNTESPSDDHVRADLYRDNQDFSPTLNAALDQQQSRDNDVLQRIEQNANGLQIVADNRVAANAREVQATATPLIQGGRPADAGVRETVSLDGRPEPPARQQADSARPSASTRPDVIIAYDDQGKEHRFPNHKIEKLPVDLDSIPDWRLKQVNARSGDLIKKFTEGTTPTGAHDGKISFHDISSIMKDIGKMNDLTEVEKCQLWTDVRLKLQSEGATLLDRDEKPEMIDSWKGSGDPWHALITMSDGYHANRLVNMTPEEASKAIQEHEHGAEANSMPFVRRMMWKTAYTVLGANTGDINASEGQLKALRELCSQGTFSAYANEWTNQFVRTDRDQYGRWKR